MAEGVGQEILAREVAMAFSGLDAGPLELVTLCRRIVSRQPAAGALWTLCARVLCSADPIDTAWAFVDELDDDRTLLTKSGPGAAATDGHERGVGPARAEPGSGSVGAVLLEAEAAGPSAALVALGGHAAALGARDAGVPVWLAVPVGRMLPGLHYDEAEDRSIGSDTGPCRLERLPLDLVDEIARSDGLRPTPAVLRRPPDGPIAPELNKRID